MYDIILYKDSNGDARAIFQGKDMRFVDLNIPLIVQLYKSVGQSPNIVLKDPADPDLNYLKSSLSESLKKMGL